MCLRRFRRQADGCLPLAGLRADVKNAWIVLFLLCSGVAADGERGLVGHWDFNEGKGQVLRDVSGNDSHGTVHGARWVDDGAGHALRFDGVDDYVDCGNDSTLDIRGPVTLSAWVRPVSAGANEAGIAGKPFDSYGLTLYRGGCWWYISGGGNNVRAPITTGRWHHVAGTFDGKRLRLYVNGAESAGGDSKHKTVNPGKNFLMGVLAPNPADLTAAKHTGRFFEGLLDEVKVYNRPLAPREIITEYNRQAQAKGCTMLDTSWFGRFRLKTFPYFERKEVVVDVDYAGLVPIPKDAAIFVDLVAAGGGARIARREVKPDPDQPRTEVTFSLDALAEGQYEVRALLSGSAAQNAETRAAFSHSAPVHPLPDPAQKAVPALPPAPPPVQYEFSLKPGGGFVVTIKGKDYPVESTYSFPHGGENRLLARDDPDGKGEPAWRVQSRKLDEKTYEVAAAGEHYAVHRHITLRDDHINVKDTITNKRQDVLGIILDNHIDTRGKSVSSVKTTCCCTLFVSGPDHGIGMIALDDVYQLQQATWHRDNVAAMVTDKLGLDKGASYTVEWAVYPTVTGEYLDFINALRKVEGLNRTVDGAFYLVGDGEGLVGPEDRRVAPSPKVIDAKGVKYVSFFYLIAPADDPGMSLEGIEFVKYPKESALLTKTIAETHRLNPGVKVMFHIAHGLYATNRPAELFGDSRVIDANGNQVLYGSNSADYYCQYFSKERFDQGHRWWIFYPTMDNSFGKAMLSAIDTMLETMGASGMYADGFVSGYAGKGYTYDRWDGHSVEIDPKTKTVKRKMGNVPYLALPVLKAVARKVAAKGGVVITNGRPGPRSLWKENIIPTCESTGGDEGPISRLYVGQAVTSFGDPQRIKTRRDLYMDMLAKLDWGALYFYYGDKNLGVAQPMISRHMYPFTLEELHRGWIKGRERIITRVPGVYGWRGSKALHKVYRSDQRGVLVPNGDFSTADASGVRTGLGLGALESAVVERIPAELETDRPVNVLVAAYGQKGLVLHFNGRAKVRLTLKTGDFAIEANQTYLCAGCEKEVVRADAEGVLRIPLDLDGATDVGISAATPRVGQEASHVNGASKGKVVKVKPAGPYECLRTPEPIKIDGRLDEPQWQRAKLVDFMIPVTHEKPLSKTEARLLWDDAYLYVAFKAYDKDIYSYFTERDSHTCYEDVLEIFLKPDPAADPYYNFEINALNTVYDAFNVQREAGGPDHHRWNRWNCEGLKSAVVIEGTLNDWQDVDEYWQLEVAIPFADLPTLEGQSPRAGDQWLFHLSRYDYSVYLPGGVELSSCAPLTEVNFHRYEDWIPLKFVK